ncbi:hypothetical protein J6590_005843 [Homalodisca vitripennis]|nr:hypothetical protein J6590_005843 [Homalodisca vitripennis]
MQVCYCVGFCTHSPQSITVQYCRSPLQHYLGLGLGPRLHLRHSSLMHVPASSGHCLVYWTMAARHGDRPLSCQRRYTPTAVVVTSHFQRPRGRDRRRRAAVPESRLQAELAPLSHISPFRFRLGFSARFYQTMRHLQTMDLSRRLFHTSAHGFGFSPSSG